MSAGYVRGYHQRENRRLQDQAGALVDLLHDDTAYPAGSRILEAGCGVGAQTITLARRSPDARFTAIDVSAESIAQARRRLGRAASAARPSRPGLIAPERFDAGIRALRRTTESDGTFCHTFFKGVGSRRA